MRLFGGKPAGKRAENGVEKPVGNSQPVYSGRNEMAALARRYALIMSTIFQREGIGGRLEMTSRGPRYLGLGVRLQDPTALKAVVELAEPLALATRVQAVIAQRSRSHPGLVSFQFQLVPHYWMTCTARDVLGSAVGIGEGRRPVPFTFDPAHAGIFGTTGSGKSSTVNTVLRSLLLTHRPDQLQLVLCDPHADHLAFEHAAHLALPIATTPDEIGQALDYAGQVLAQRKAERNRQAPRLVVVVDEAEHILLDERNLANVKAIGGEAAKFNVHLILSTQKPMEKYMPGVLGNIGNRWIGLVDNARTSATLSGQAGLNCHRLTGHGDFIHVAGGVVDVERLQVALMSEHDFDAIPRAAEEVDWPEIPREDTPRLLAMPVDKPGPGRPARSFEPEIVAAYDYFGPDRISISQAAEMLHLTRYAHDQYKSWVIRFREAKAHLEEASHGNV